MKVKSALVSLILILSVFCLPAESAESKIEPNLEILKVYGHSKEIGIFRDINSPFFTSRNYYKQGLAFDSTGNLYVTDSGEGQIEVFDADLKPIRHFGSVGNGDGQFQYLVDIKIDQDEIYTLDLILGRIQVFTLEGQFLYRFDTALPTDEFISYPTGFAISLHKKIFVMDLFNGLKIFDRKGTLIQLLETEDFISGYARTGYGPFDFFFTLEDMKTDENGNVFCLMNGVGDGCPFVVILNPEGQLYSEELFIINLSDYYTPNGLFALEGDYIYATLWSPQDEYWREAEGIILCYRMKLPFSSEEEENEEIHFEEIVSGVQLNEAGISIVSPTAFQVRDEHLFFLDSEQNAITQINLKGEKVSEFESTPSVQGILHGIYGDNQGNIFTTNQSKGCIEVRNQDLEVTATIGKPGNPGFLSDLGEFGCPYSTITDSKGYFYCSDYQNCCIQVFDQNREPYFTYYPLEHLESPAETVINSDGNLLLLTDKGYQILSLDISQIEQKKISVIQKINWDEEDRIQSFAVTEKNNYLIPVHDDGILAEIGSNGKVKRRWYNPLKSKKIEVITLPYIVWKDDNQNFMLVDGWSGYFWKYNQDIKNIWTEKMNWFGINEAWESNDGIIYAIDKVHNLILVLKDRSFNSIASVSLVLDPIPEATYEEKLMVKGITDSGATIKINEEMIPVNEEGEFEKEMSLQLGENVWIISATHPSKKETIREIKVIRKQRIIIRMKVNSTMILINQEQKILEAPPFLEKSSNRVFAPIRIVVEAVEGKVEWEATEQKVTIHLGDIELILIVDEPFAYLNGKKILIDPINEYNKMNPVVPKIVNGRVFLPLRFIGENLGFLVEWKGDTQEIILTYPDPKQSEPVFLSQKLSGNSFGKVISYSLADGLCKVYPSDQETTLAFIPSGYQYTSIMHIDSTGTILPSQVVNTSGNILKLSNHQFLILDQNGTTPFIKENPNGFCFTWIDETGKPLRSKLLTFDYQRFEIIHYDYLRATENGGFELMMTAITLDQQDIFDSSVLFRMEFSADGEIEQSTMLPYMYSQQYRINETGYAFLSSYGEASLTMYDLSGKILWAKKILASENETTPNTLYYEFSWLEDGSLLLYAVDADKNLSISRLNKDGELIWDSRILKQNTVKSMSLSDPVLLGDGRLACNLSYHLTSKNVGKSVLIFDENGDIESVYDVNLDYDSAMQIQTGEKGDLWIGSYTSRYAYGMASSVLFQILPGDNNACFQPEVTFQNNHDTFHFEAISNAKPIKTEHKRIHNTIKDREITVQPVRILTKDLCS